MKKVPLRFDKLLKFVKKEKDQEENKAVAERSSPQDQNIPDLQPYQEAEMINKKRKALQQKEGRRLYESES